MPTRSVCGGAGIAPSRPQLQGSALACRWWCLDLRCRLLRAPRAQDPRGAGWVLVTLTRRLHHGPGLRQLARAKGSPLPSPGPRLTCACSGGWGRSFLRWWEIVGRAAQCPVQCCPAAPVPWAASQILGLCFYSPGIYARCSSQPKTAAAKVLIFDDLDPRVTMRVWFLKRVLSVRMAGTVPRTKTGWKFSCLIGGFSVSSCNLKSN